jgi:outer membrane protein assembly factor BamB
VSRLRDGRLFKPVIVGNRFCKSEGTTVPPRYHTLRAALLVTTAALVLFAAPAPGADWPHWRGPDRNGITPESSGYPGAWPPKRLWATNVGVGCTSPVIAGGRLYVMGWHGSDRSHSRPGGRDVVRCLDARSGKELWKQSYPARYQSRLRTGDTSAYGGPSSTPSYDPETGYLYTLSVDGDLRCWNAKAGGKGVWGVNLHDVFKVPQRPDTGAGVRDYGFSGSPLVLGKHLVVEVGDDSGTVVAFEKRRGKPVWRSEAREPGGHTGGPAPFRVGGVPCLANLALRKLIILRLDPGHEGRTVAEVPWSTHYANNIPTPAVWDNHVLVTSSYNVSRTVLFEVTPRGLREKWRTADHAKVGSPVIHKGRVFLVHRDFMCLDLATGRRLWKGGDFLHGSCLVTAGDDKVLAFGKGRLVLLDALAKGYKELAKTDRLLRATCYPHPAVADGLVAVKDMAGDLACLSLRK